MQIPSSLAAALPPSASAVMSLLGRLSQTAQALPVAQLTASLPAAGTLTPDMVRAALLDMGVPATEADVALAELLVQTGLPLTLAELTDAHRALAASPGATPQAYALAKSLNLPATPAALKALTTVLTAQTAGHLPSPQALPQQVRGWLGLGMDAGTAPLKLSRHLREMMLQTGRSTEHRLASGIQDGDPGLPVADARTALLRLVLGSADPALRAEADHLASHLEGQQLLNQASLQAHANCPETPLYLAVPLAFGGPPVLVEMRLWSPQRRGESLEAEEVDEPELNVTVRVALPRLGRVQADLSGRMTGSLSCRLGVEKVGAQRLLARHTGLLAEALGDAGWTSCDVTCRTQSDWPPLWHGGDALTTPRPCVDRHV